MNYGFPFGPDDVVIELGGGNKPYFRPNLDVRSGENIDIVADFNEPLPLKDNQYDGVLSVYCIEHLSWRKVKLFISESYRILKNNGRVVFITANTERQMQHVLSHEEWNDDASCILFGDQDYPENTHKNSLCPRYAIQMMAEAGFTNVVVLPWGELGTDMIIEAKKVIEEGKKNVNNEAIDNKYNREYFDNPHYYGIGTGFYRDHPTNWNVFSKIMQMAPQSVLEIGCGRGYIVKRLNSAGIKAHGMEMSQHCLLTRVTDDITNFDIRNTPWPFENGQFDFVFSQDVLDNIDPGSLQKVMSEIKRVTKRGLHGVSRDLGLAGEGQSYISSYELTSGPLEQNIPQGDDKVKLNIGSFTVMLHHGWINTDIVNLTRFASENGYRFLQMDSSKPLPVQDGIVDFIVSSHMLEHITWEEGLQFLQECFRIMKPGAVMRIAVPDTERLIELYKNKWLGVLDEMNLNAAKYSTQSPKFWSYLFDGHRIAYDWESLSQIGEMAGFKVIKSSFNEGHPTFVKESMDYLPEISLYVEMTKP